MKLHKASWRPRRTPGLRQEKCKVKLQPFAVPESKDAREKERERERRVQDPMWKSYQCPKWKQLVQQNNYCLEFNLKFKKKKKNHYRYK